MAWSCCLRSREFLIHAALGVLLFLLLVEGKPLLLSGSIKKCLLWMYQEMFKLFLLLYLLTCKNLRCCCSCLFEPVGSVVSGAVYYQKSYHWLVFLLLHPEKAMSVYSCRS
ncbi:hypothetical protein R3W88_013139 [Solanum pinnatisectum]|uniref:Secreted protein n=1 Tax=Solanum pinnatisectum TaxID=50273 RepID=A0AAV9LAZ0_9SOLN|nr:hypothetical protein R3W88_013139 [Solanum pinnatisectum]